MRPLLKDFVESPAKVLRRSGRKSKCILKGVAREALQEKTWSAAISPEKEFRDASCVFNYKVIKKVLFCGVVRQVMNESP